MTWALGAALLAIFLGERDGRAVDRRVQSAEGAPLLRVAHVGHEDALPTHNRPGDDLAYVENELREALDEDAGANLRRHLRDLERLGDPPGFALENYDVIGGWRTRYRTVRTKTKGPKVDPSYAMPDGREFDGIDQFKKLALADPRQIARNFATKLATLSTGAPVSFVDRGAIEGILSQAEPSGYGVRSLIHAVIDSPVFLNK